MFAVAMTYTAARRRFRRLLGRLREAPAREARALVFTSRWVALARRLREAPAGEVRG